MAEPIGIAASVVTLVKTSRMIGNGISKLLALKHAPDVLLALNNDVVDLEYVIVSSFIPSDKTMSRLRLTYSPRSIYRTLSIGTKRR